MPIIINGLPFDPPEDARVSLLDMLRDGLGLFGTKKGCNQGACGACTVVVDGQRILSCLALASQYDGRDVSTIEGLAEGEDLHPLQALFVEHDGLQCGYCTPGQIMSGIALRDEFARGAPSSVTANFDVRPLPTREEIRERMSGNLCRCGAHNGIVDAISSYISEAQ